MQYGLIGEKLGHSWSKIIHEAFGLYSYDLKELDLCELGPFLESKDFKGLNVTIPYKRAVIPYLDSVDEAARAIGAVNTIVNRDGRLEGHNTDVTGFRFMLAGRGIDPSGKKVLILGTGGASAAVKAGLLMDGAGEIVFVSRKRGQKADASDLTVTYEEACRDHTDADIIVNATPVGMYPKTDASPIDLEPFKKCRAVCDIIYNPQVTRLAAQAESLGMTAVTGLDMLVQQAVDAAGFFLGRPLPEEAFVRAKDEVLRAMDG